MFVNDKKREGMTDINNIVRRVDSDYALKLLKRRGGLHQLKRFYLDAVEGKATGLIAWSYEAYWHEWLEKNQPNGIKFFCDMGENKPLDSKNLYWVPGSETYPFIDAALVRNETLYAIQYTTQNSRKRELNILSLMTEFVAPLRETLQDIKTVSILFVTPDIDFNEPKLSFARIVKKRRGGQPLPPSSAEVTCNSKLKYCTVDDAEISYDLLIIYADVQAEWTPGFPFLER
jgi:hypothetical protein